MDESLWSRSRIPALCGAGVLGLFALLAALVWPWGRFPSVEALREYRPPQASRVLDREGHLLARLAPEERVVVPLSAMSPRLVASFLAVEDRRFYAHHGVDWRRVAGALLRDLRTLSLREGSSTITMQLARNLFPQRLARARTLRRKLAEMLIARRIEAAFSKEQILELYLNQIYLGNGYYGVEAAARGYFGKSARDVGTAQAALLAALPKAPSLFDPRRFPDAALRRRNLVLRMTAAAGAITSAEAAGARKAPLRLKPPEEEAGAPWLVAEARHELVDRFGPEAATMGLRVRTNLDMGLQRAAERELLRQLAAVEGKGGCDGDDCLQGLFVALDVRTGDVLALVGGRDYARSQFDRALQARRQPGSAFKPIVWAAALQAGIPVSTLLDIQAPVGDYAPSDEPSAGAGPLNLRQALRISSNRAAVALGTRVGLPAVVSTARALGLSTPIPEYPSSFLGAAEVSPLELVAAFTAFASDGVRAVPRFIDEVRGPGGELLYLAPVQRKQALYPGVSFILADLLTDVVERGTGTAARRGLLPELPLFGKTGTTNAGQDVWFVGATPEIAAGVWLGYDRPRPLGPGATGGRLAAPLFARVLASWERGRPLPSAWAPPPDLERREVDVATGGRAIAGCPREQVASEWFVPGTAPEECPLHRGGIAGFLQRAVESVGSLFR